MDENNGRDGNAVGSTDSGADSGAVGGKGASAKPGGAPAASPGAVRVAGHERQQAARPGAGHPAAPGGAPVAPRSVPGARPAAAPAAAQAVTPTAANHSSQTQGFNSGQAKPSRSSVRASSYAMGAQRRKPLWFYLMLTLIICSTVVILVVGCVNLLGKGGGAQSSGGDFVPPSVKYVSKMYIVGEIGDYGDEYTSSQQSFHYRYTLDTIDSLIADPNNVGLVLYMNSPGGTVYESDEVYLKVMEYKEKTKRPVYVYMSSMAASGAYYIAAAADRIYANRNTWTGSIGVISGTFFDVSGFLKKHGIKATDIVSGRNKGMGSYFQPMTKEQRAILQSLVDEAYMQFVGIVSAGRGLTVEKTIELADGRIYTATQAKAAGLIDQVMGEQDAYADIRKTLGDEDLQIVDTVFEAQERLLDIFGMPINGKAAGGGAGAGASDSDAGASGADALSPGDIARVLDMVENADPFQLQYLFVG